MLALEYKTFVITLESVKMEALIAVAFLAIIAVGIQLGGWVDLLAILF